MKKKTSDALEILRKRFPVEPGSAAERRMEKYYRDLKVAEDLFELRTKAGLTQDQLAKKVGTSRTAIARLEDAEYRGHSVRMLEKIARALDHRVEIVFRPVVRTIKGRVVSAAPGRRHRANA